MYEYTGILVGVYCILHISRIRVNNMHLHSMMHWETYGTCYLVGHCFDVHHTNIDSDSPMTLAGG
jgi:hypothetical protein